MSKPMGPREAQLRALRIAEATGQERQGRAEKAKEALRAAEARKNAPRPVKTSRRIAQADKKPDPEQS